MGSTRRGVGEVEEMLRPSSTIPSSSTPSKQLPLLALNHVSFVCKSVRRSVRFYEEVLGFVLVQRPSSFNFLGAWLFNYGIGIHLLEVDDVKTKEGSKINPKDNHISFQCSDMARVVQLLEEMGIDYMTAAVEEGGVTVDQMFFHDPDGYMVEICNCQNLPILPLSSSSPSSCSLKSKNNVPNAQDYASSTSSAVYGKQSWDVYCSKAVESLMMDNLVVSMIGISI